MAGVSTTLVWSGKRARAQALLAGISADDPDTFVAEIIGEGEEVELKIVVEGDSLKSVRVTVDDILACLAAADSSLDVLNSD